MIRMDIKRTDFYNELSKEQQKEYFYVKARNYLPAIDNIYYSCFIEDDRNDNPCLKPLLDTLEELKVEALRQHSPVPYVSLDVKPTGFSIYKYCITVPDLYDIFILDYLPNDDTPRILVQIRAYGLWLYGADKMLIDSFNTVLSILDEVGASISKTRENRIDYCYHTNAIQNPEKVFSDRNINNQMQTTMTTYHVTGRIDMSSTDKKLSLEYFSLGQRKSNNVFIRCYNKALEVVEMGYKGFFFDMWHQNNIISFYDKYCLEYAFAHKDFMTAIEKAKMYFYIEYGTDNLVKNEYKAALGSKSTTFTNLKELTEGVMPQLTTVMNIEFETKRKFYYYSDAFINDVLSCTPREDAPNPLTRIFKIIDNKSIFLDYLTSTTMSFFKGDKYVSWWQDLRNAKLDGIKADTPLLREYGKNLDERLAKVKFINSVAVNAVYSDNLNSDFMEDVSDLMSNLNDNNMVTFKAVLADEEALKELQKENPDFDPSNMPHFFEFDSLVLSGYITNKKRKEVYVKNRKKKGQGDKNG